MRIFHREFGHRYDSYEFGYTTFGTLEPTDVLDEVYAGGFLPYSADPAVTDLFYMARSVRVPLADFRLSSENRRIQRKFEGQFTSTVLSQREAMNDPDVLACLLTYFQERHGERVMSEARAKAILTTPLPLRVIAYEKNGVRAGYVLEVAMDRSVHYWYSCYASTYTGTSFGMWLMLDAVERAARENRSYIYLGTAYGTKGRYKTNFSPLEFWNGSEWNADPKLLKNLIASS